jgi:hypothetical protein
MTFRRVMRAWDEFLFAPISPVPLAVYRILLGTLVIINVLFLLPNAEILFGDHGILPRADALQYTPRLRYSLLYFLPATPFWLYTFFTLLLVAALCLTVGLFTRLAALLVFVGLVSVQYRNLAITHSGDAFLRLASFYLMLSPAGRALSIDRWLRVRRGVEPPGEPAPVAPWAQRLIQIQLSVIYVATVWWKIGGFTWIQGTAVYYSTRLHELERFPVPFLFQFRPFMTLMTWGTLALELALGTLVWFRDLRYPLLLAGLLLHLGLEYSINIPLFQWTMIAAYVLFLDPRDVQRALDRLRRRPAAAHAPVHAPSPALAHVRETSQGTGTAI